MRVTAEILLIQIAIQMLMLVFQEKREIILTMHVMLVLSLFMKEV